MLLDIRFFWIAKLLPWQHCFFSSIQAVPLFWRGYVCPGVVAQGRKARLKANHTINSAHHRRGRTAPMSSIANSTTTYGNRTSRPAHSYTPTPEDSQHSLVEFNAAAPKDSPEDDKVIVLAEFMFWKCRSSCTKDVSFSDSSSSLLLIDAKELL